MAVNYRNWCEKCDLLQNKIAFIRFKGSHSIRALHYSKQGGSSPVASISTTSPFFPLPFPQIVNVFPSIHFSLLGIEQRSMWRNLANTEDPRAHECACWIKIGSQRSHNDWRIVRPGAESRSRFPRNLGFSIPQVNEDVSVVILIN